MHRHMHCNIDLFSQCWSDTDKMIRDLADEIWLIRRIGPISYARCVYVRIGIDENTHQLQYQHFFRSIFLQLLPFQPKQFIFCFRPFHYKHFNSFSPLNREVIPSPPGGFKTTFSELNIKQRTYSALFYFNQFQCTFCMFQGSQQCIDLFLYICLGVT